MNDPVEISMDVMKDYLKIFSQIQLNSLDNVYRAVSRVAPLLLAFDEILACDKYHDTIEPGRICHRARGKAIVDAIVNDADAPQREPFREAITALAAILTEFPGFGDMLESTLVSRALHAVLGGEE